MEGKGNRSHGQRRMRLSNHLQGSIRLLLVPTANIELFSPFAAGQGPGWGLPRMVRQRSNGAEGQRCTSTSQTMFPAFTSSSGSRVAYSHTTEGETKKLESTIGHQLFHF